MYHRRFLSYINDWERRYNDLNLKLESYRPDDIINDKENVLLEAGKISDAISSGIQKLKDLIIKMNKKFQRTNTDLRQKNADILVEASTYKIDSKNMENFTHEIFPYWKGMQLMTGINVPQYTTITDKNILNNESEFKKKYFESVLNNDGSIDKDKFRGASEKMNVNNMNAPAVFRSCLNYVRNRDSISISISRSNTSLTHLLDNLDKNITISESTLLDMSIFQSDYWSYLLESILLEDVDPTTTTESEKEQKQEDSGNKGTIESNNSENKEANKTKTENDNIKNFVKWCYDFNTVKMSILDEGYDECIKFIAKVMNKK